jgi:hypothetical protein
MELFSMNFWSPAIQHELKVKSCIKLMRNSLQLIPVGNVITSYKDWVVLKLGIIENDPKTFTKPQL